MHPTLLLLTLFYILTRSAFVNAGGSHILSRSLRHSHLRHVRVQQRDAINDLPAGWAQVGCYTDRGAFRTLTSVGYTDTKDMTIETCVNFCNTRNFFYAGVENGQECHCGNAISNGTMVSESDCSIPCNGNVNENCGARLRLNMYRNGAASPPVPVIAPNYGQWVSLGCYSDTPVMRTLSHRGAVLGGAYNNSVQGCTDACLSLGYSLAGVEYGKECFCGSAINSGAAPSGAAPTPLSDCSVLCTGNGSEFCGGRNRLNLYNYTGTNQGSISVTPTVQTTNLPGNWQYSRCLAEPGGTSRVFPYQIMFPQTNTVQGCLTQCSTFGYPAAGLENGNECWCGDVADISNNNGTTAAETDCNMPCSGDPSHLCGGSWRLQLYIWDGALNNWQTPPNIGRYEYIITAPIPAIVATVGINGKISFLEKYGNSLIESSTGAYELDLSLLDEPNRAWRTMHTKTNTWCSATVVLPDRAARILNAAGWSDDGAEGLRLYAPDGSPGINGTNDWEESPTIFRLQSERWYPTALVLSNGSVLVMGGSKGAESDGSNNPTLEILPRIPGGDTQVYLDFLQRTSPNNLYPYLHVLPSGGIFVGYHNEARILDPKSFDTVKVLPNIPGSVSSPAAGRSYPNEASAILLPQFAPYTDPITVLICGGSDFGTALDNCVSIEPDSANPMWTIERMPSKRVMPCIVPLPDGTFMIMNGAQEGVAGFKDASDPNLSALLYDPSQPVGSRISILNSTTIPRMYHSEATLLPDGRVLVSGSDPETRRLPEELRIEVYIPPYLNQGYTQPIVTVPNTDWQYGGQYQINVQLFQNQAIRVSLVAAVSSTHGNVMGARTIFPEFSCADSVCTVTAPPNANVSPPAWYQLFILDGPTPSHSVFVRVGGDPAQLGKWPNLPGFTLPGE